MITSAIFALLFFASYMCGLVRKHYTQLGWTDQDQMSLLADFMALQFWAGVGFILLALKP